MTGRALGGGYLTTVYERRRSIAYRAKMRAARLCINAPSHGRATHGVRCRVCAYKAHPPLDRPKCGPRVLQPKPARFVIEIKRSERKPWEHIITWRALRARDAFALALAVERIEPRFYAMRAVQL